LPKPKILFIDVETFPNIAYVWGKYDQNVIRFLQEGCIATFAAKWAGEKVFSRALPDYKGYKGGSYDDKKLVEDLWRLLDEADIVVAHNGDDFDVRVIRGRFVCHGLVPPSPFKTVDTKKVAKRVGRFNSNSLDDLGSLLGLGKKIKTDFDLWKGCIDGDKTAWRQMVVYNEKDVVLLEKLYNKLLPWATNHPNHGAYNDSAICPKCGGTDVQFRGEAVTTTRRYQRFQCKKCGGWGRFTKSLHSGKSVNVTG
jgi:hypothetical protein